MLKFDYISVYDLTPYHKNTRLHQDADIDAIALSIKKYGFNDPVGVYGKDNIIVEGHGRVLAYKKILSEGDMLGDEKIPCIHLDHLTDEERKEYAIMHNKTAELSEWDFDMLEEELAELDLSDFDIDFGVFDENEVDFDDDLEVIEDEPPAISDEEPMSENGQIYRLGRHILMVGDSTDFNDVKRLIGDYDIDLVITDPPYNVDYRSDSGMKIKNDYMGDDDFYQFLLSAFTNMNEFMKAGCPFYIWYSFVKQSYFEKALNDCELKPKQEIIWNKNNFVIGRHDYHWKHENCFYGWKGGSEHYFIDNRSQITVFEDEKPDFNTMKKEDMKKLLEELYADKLSTTIINEKKESKNSLHPTMKPVKLIARLILNSSRQKENVLDLFGGSGSTLMACEQTNRNCFMMEYDPKYADVIIKRWEKFTGENAVLING